MVRFGVVTMIDHKRLYDRFQHVERFIKALPIIDKLGQLEETLVIMKTYMRVCQDREDWHGMMDAAADI